MQEKRKDDPLIVFVLLDQRMGPVAVHLRLGDPAVGDAGVRYRPAEAHVEGVHHAVGGVQPAEGLEDDLVDGAGALAVDRRAADALAGEGQASGEQQGHRRPVVKPKDEGVLSHSLDLEERADRAEDVDHLQHYWHDVEWRPCYGPAPLTRLHPMMITLSRIFSSFILSSFFASPYTFISNLKGHTLEEPPNQYHSTPSPIPFKITNLLRCSFGEFHLLSKK